jgi:beta-galactosidase
MPLTPLPAGRPIINAYWDQPEIRSVKTGQGGNFITSFSYSGPTAGVRVEKNAQDGGKVLADRDASFSGLSAELKGADYVRAAAADARYNAVDLMEIAVKAGSTIFVAHDDRLGRPDWLTRQFKPADATVVIDGHPLRIFQHPCPNDESLTLGTNTENANAPADSSMYIVFVNGRR